MAKRLRTDPDSAERLALALEAAGVPVKAVKVPAPPHPPAGRPDQLITREDGVRVLVVFDVEATAEQRAKIEEVVRTADLRVREAKPLGRLVNELLASGADLPKLAAAWQLAEVIRDRPLWGLKHGLPDGAELPQKEET